MNPRVWAATGAQRKRKRKKKTRGQKEILYGGKKYKNCVYCQKQLPLHKATLDHVKAFSRGGYERLSNAAIACRRCNGRKGSMSREDFINKMTAGWLPRERKGWPAGCLGGFHEWQYFAGYRYCTRCGKDDLIEHIDL